MKTLRQYDIQKILAPLGQSAISKKFRMNSFKGSEIAKISKELGINPSSLFDKEAQKKVFGVSFIK